MTAQVRAEVMAEKLTEVKTGELTVQDYEIVGFDESIVPVNRIVELKEKFVPMLQSFDTHNINRAAILEEFEQYKLSGEAAPKSLIDKAFRHRNDIAKIRITTEKARKSCNEDLNKAKSGNDALAKYIKDNVSTDEAEMKEIEIHNEKIEAARLKVVQEERSKIAADVGFSEEMDFSGMAQTIFDSFIAGERVKRDEAIDAKLKQDLRISRQTQCLNLSEHIPHYEAIDLAELDGDAFEGLLNDARQKQSDINESIRIANEKDHLNKSRKLDIMPYYDFIEDDYKDRDLSEFTQDEFNDILSTLKQRKIDHDQKQEEIKAENDRLLGEAKEVEEKARAEKIKQSERSKQLQPYIVFIRDYDSLLSMSDEDYLKEYEEIQKGANAQWEFDRKEAERIQNEKEAREAREADEKTRQAEAQRIANEEREKAEKKVHEAKEAEALKTLEAEEAREAEELAKAKLKEAEDAEAQRIESIKSLAESSKEITVEALNKVIEEGQTIFVQVISVEKIEGKSGIFIKPSDK